MDIPQVAPQSVSELPSQPVFNGTVKDEPQTSVHAQPAENGQDESDDALYSMSMHERLKLEKRRAAQNAEKSFSLTASATVTKEEFPAPNTRKRKKAPAGKAVKKRKVEKPAEDNDIYIVESIISVRSEGDPIVTGQPLLGKSALLMVHPGDLQSDNIKKRYLVHWEGYGDAGRTWEPEEHLSSAKLMLKEFWKRRVAARKKVGAAMRLVCALARWRVRVRKK
ncbi:uncharacterized protein EV422DRAFT_566165 [Fimicolochytrium jonesii]|uniref:uncharacterized protein n=1 Tax=Fimicolochytrium jonesii TaxID=1396493 RepID=UPI0022FDFFF7|nr:uncharacterized protein EV422DRAFT_566165 [Fimicolochytrium jonesii]KAI8822476.1 hypothetical protein EV422DRAFT_566165 [Fimicolochytrium jonesii]